MLMSLREKHPGTFLTSTQDKTRIDFIYSTPALYKYIKNANIVYDKYTTPVRDEQNLSNFYRPSDHRPIIINFDFGKTRK
jgi:exonuclease III